MARRSLFRSPRANSPYLRFGSCVPVSKTGMGGGKSCKANDFAPVTDWRASLWRLGQQRPMRGKTFHQTPHARLGGVLRRSAVIPRARRRGSRDLPATHGSRAGAVGHGDR